MIASPWRERQFNDPLKDASSAQLCKEWASLVAQRVKYPLAMWETWVQSLGQEDPLEKGMEWLRTPIFWPGELHEQKILTGYSPWGCIVNHN